VRSADQKASPKLWTRADLAHRLPEPSAAKLARDTAIFPLEASRVRHIAAMNRPRCRSSYPDFGLRITRANELRTLPKMGPGGAYAMSLTLDDAFLGSSMA
jgi:hypothetical protein